MSAVRQRITTDRTEVILQFDFDWKNPDYQAIFLHRATWLAELRAKPQKFVALWDWYAKGNWAQFICDWGCTFDPRNPERGLPSTVPFILFPKQIQWIEWFFDRWHASEPGITEKSRDCGVSWIAMALTNTLCIFKRGLGFGFGSAKADKVDRSDDIDALFPKGRFFLNNLPQEFRGGFREERDASYMRIIHRRTGSALTGEAGENIGRGGRKSAYFLDEAAHLEHPQTVESSLLSNTNCRIDISSVAGMGNPFAQKRHAGKIKVFTFHWRDDPRKGQAWYDKLKETTDEVTLAQDVDINYLASAEGAVIPPLWVQASIGAAERLGYAPSGTRRMGLDVADQGIDTNCAAVRYGSMLEHLESWSGKDSDTFRTTARALSISETYRCEGLEYDADGLGAFVRGDANAINEQRVKDGKEPILVNPFRGSATGDAMYDADGEMVKERKNRDYFASMKSLSWWALRIRFQNVHRAVNGQEYDPDNIICIDPNLPELIELTMELAQVLYTINTSGKVVIDKAPEGARSPNRADSVMIAFNPSVGWADVWSNL